MRHPAPCLPFLPQKVGLLSSLIDKKAAELQIFLLARQPVQLHQRKLDFLMPVIAFQLAFLRAKYGIDMIGHTAHRIQQLVLARGFIIGNRSFDEMSGTVQFMAVLEIGPAFAGLLNRKIGIQIAIRLLSCGD
ncbi:hypothetical protein D3C74_371550 [compost metagenome]